jgi:hypothetical protein
MHACMRRATIHDLITAPLSLVYTLCTLQCHHNNSHLSAASNHKAQLTSTVMTESSTLATASAPVAFLEAATTPASRPPESVGGLASCINSSSTEGWLRGASSKYASTQACHHDGMDSIYGQPISWCL